MTSRPAGRYVYAITGASAAPPRARGVGGRALVRVRAGRVAAIAEPMARPFDASLERLDAQERLVRRLAARHSPMLPARFGSFVRDEAELRGFLRSRGPALARALRRVMGSQQMILRLFMATGDRPARSGTAYLRRRAGRDVPALAAIRTALERLRLLRGERLEVQDSSISVYHLIPHGSARRYSTAVQEAVARESGVAAVVSGPWPPYAFAPELLE